MTSGLPLDAPACVEMRPDRLVCRRGLVSRAGMRRLTTLSHDALNWRCGQALNDRAPPVRGARWSSQEVGSRRRMSIGSVEAPVRGPSWVPSVGSLLTVACRPGNLCATQRYGCST